MQLDSSPRLLSSAPRACSCTDCLEDSIDNTWCVQAERCYPANAFGGKSVHVRFDWVGCRHVVHGEMGFTAGNLCAKANAEADSWKRNRWVGFATPTSACPDLLLCRECTIVIHGAKPAGTV